MEFYAHKTTPLNGRLLVMAIQTDGIDQSLGIQLTHNPSDTLFAEVVRSSDEDTYPVGCVVMYDRIHGRDIELLDQSGSPQTYKVIQTVDVSLILLE